MPSAAGLDLEEEEEAGDDAAEPLNDLGRCRGCTAGSEAVVDNKDPLAHLDCVVWHLDGARAVLEAVRLTDELGVLAHRYLAGLAHHDRTLATPLRNGLAEDKAAGVDHGDQVEADARELELALHLAEAGLFGRGVPEQGADVTEHDARLREVRDRFEELRQVVSC